MKPKRYESGMVFVGAEDLRVELDADETSVFHAASGRDSYYTKVAILRLLKAYGNAKKVWQVIELLAARGEKIFLVDNIIVNIGEMSPEEYIEYVDKAVAEFNAKGQEYYHRFEAAKNQRERTAAVQWWSDYLDSLHREREKNS